MSGYDFTYDMYIAPYDYCGRADAFEVSTEIEELEEWNSDLTQKMLMMVAGGASTVNLNDVEGNPCEPVDVLHGTFTQYLKDYTDNLEKIFKLRCFLEHINEQDGNA